MPYVSRNDKGMIVQVQHSCLDGQMPWLDDDDPELKAFLSQAQVAEQAKQNLATTDLEMVRIIEDLVDLLMSKNVFIFTELPLPVQEKLGLRKQFRKEMHSLDNLIGDDEGIF